MTRLRTLLVERPYAELIYRQQAKLVISQDKLPAGCELNFADTEQQYGTVILGKGKPLAISQFRRLAKQHRIPDEERVAMWPKARRLYAHTVHFKSLNDPPLLWTGPPPMIETRHKRAPYASELTDETVGEKLDVLLCDIELFNKRIGPFITQTLQLTKASKPSKRLLNQMITLGRDVRVELAKALEVINKEPLPDHAIDPRGVEYLPNTLTLAASLAKAMQAAAPLLPRTTRLRELCDDGAELLEAFIKVANGLREDTGLTVGIRDLRATKPSTASECNADDTDDVELPIYKGIAALKDEITVCDSFLYIIDKADLEDPQLAFHDRFRLEGNLKKDVTHRVAPKDMDIVFGDYGPTERDDAIPAYDLVCKKREDYQAYIELRDGGVMDMVSATSADAYTDLPENEAPKRSILQLHIRGKTAHLDFRIKPNGHLIGFTLAAQIAGRVPQVASIEEAKKLAEKFDVKGSRWNKALVSPKRVFATLKAVHPTSWLKLTEETFEPGSVGGSKYHAGYMVKIASPIVSFGVQTPDFHEYFLEQDKEFQGILVLRRIEREPDKDNMNEEGKSPNSFWTAMLKQKLLPYIVSPRALRQDVKLPKGYAFLPPGLKASVPERFQYWKPNDLEERKEMHEAFVNEGFFTEQNVKLVNGVIRKVVVRHYLYNPDPLAGGIKDAQKKADTQHNTHNQHHGPPTDQEDTMSRQDGQTENAGPRLKTEIEIDKRARALVGVEREVRLLKYETRRMTPEGEDEERFVLGEVLVPDEDDSQEDTYDAEEVRRAAHYFMEYSPQIGLMHERTLSRKKVRILESYIAPIDMNVEGRFIKQGTWLLGARIADDALWESVKDGTFSGWSIEGTAIAEEIS